jgi:hypothetical protein
MGLFVVGRLASRHGVGVRLASTDQVRGGGSGVTASVTLPAAVIANAGAVADRIGTTNALPTGATEAVTRAGVMPSGLANGVAVNGTGPHGPGINGTGRVNGTGTGFGGVAAASAAPRDGGSDGDPNGLPRRNPGADSGALPRRAVGAALGGTAPQADGPSESPAGRQDAVAASAGLAGDAPDEFTESRQFTGSGHYGAPQGDFAEAEEPAVREPVVRERVENGRSRRDAVDGSRPMAARPDARPDAWPDNGQDGVEGSRPMAARQDGVEGSRPMPARQDVRQEGVEGSRPMVARQDVRQDGVRQDGVEGSRPMPANGRPPAGGPRRMPQQPYLRGTRGQGPPPPMRFGQPAGPPNQQQPNQQQPGQQGQSNQQGQPVGSPSGQYPAAPAGQPPAPPPAPPRSRHRPNGSSQPPPGPADSAQLAAASPLPSPSSMGEPADDRGYAAQPAPEAPVGRAAARALSRSDAASRGNGAPSRLGRSSAAGRDPEGESPIFAEMASAWFRENWEGGGRSADGRDDSAGADSGETWAAGDALLQPMPDAVESELTTAGLPKRRPRTNLIPGGPSEDGGNAPPGIPARSAEQVRGRLASYQQGVRQGRESRHRRTETANTGGRQMQENFGEENP